ncbi:hypothetical protein AGR1A_pAt20606 [Agrobacterium fabacearum CFBP 5771]|jgi:hypothetical protein|uniref:hypothetical protein n=1 Tax=Agrobacterium tumefaciens TaxID=358 RepID=UPI0009BC1540|nr:hypothetical protein [Agrobacterium tumefaciens]CVI24969.1 hypothetical protein AGR1A_pAt20606 [Agrobacterium fabacearum CFBP 5771]
MVEQSTASSFTLVKPMGYKMPMGYKISSAASAWKIMSVVPLLTRHRDDTQHAAQTSVHGRPEQQYRRCRGIPCICANFSEVPFVKLMVYRHGG